MPSATQLREEHRTKPVGVAHQTFFLVRRNDSPLKRAQVRGARMSNLRVACGGRLSGALISYVSLPPGAAV